MTATLEHQKMQPGVPLGLQSQPAVRTAKFRVLAGYHCQPVHPPEYRTEILHGVDKQGRPVEEAIKVPISRLWLGRVVDGQGTLIREGEVVESTKDLCRRLNMGPGSQKFERVPDSTPAHPGHPIHAEVLPENDQMEVFDNDFAPQRQMTDAEVEAAYQELLRRRGESGGRGSANANPVPPVPPPTQQAMPILPNAPQFHDSSPLASLEAMSVEELKRWCASEEVALPPSAKSKADILKVIKGVVK